VHDDNRRADIINRARLTSKFDSKMTHVLDR